MVESVRNKSQKYHRLGADANAAGEENITDQEKHSIKLTEQCFLHFEFCAEDYETCQKSHQEFFEMVKASIAERDALRADLDAVCAGKFVDICCICGHYTPDHPSEKCELKGLTCKWVWRGVQKEAVEMSREILSEQQLLQQKTRRESLLKKLRAENAPPAAITEAEKKLRLTEIRLDRIHKAQ